MKWDKAGYFSALNFSDGREFKVAPVADEIGGPVRPVIYVVDDEYFSRCSIRAVLEGAGYAVEEFLDCESFLRAYRPSAGACLVLDVHFPGMSGLELLDQLKSKIQLPTVLVSGSSNISEAVKSMKSGAMDFIEKPVESDRLLEAIRAAMSSSKWMESVSHLREVAIDHLADLTTRQKEIMNLVLAGHPSKNIAYELGISQRTVENHRASIMHKTGATSLPALARLVIAASHYRQDLTPGLDNGEQPL